SVPSTHIPPTDVHTLSLHDALPIFTLAFDADKPDYGAEVELSWTVSNAETIGILNPLGEVLFEGPAEKGSLRFPAEIPGEYRARSEEHTSELQSRENLVCRLLLEKK